MKNYPIVLIAFLFVQSSCGINNASSTASVGDSTTNAELDNIGAKGVQGLMQIRDTITIGEPVELRFTATNTADTIQHFLKWATPFEPLVSKYLDITDEDGTQVDYRGAMAKRAMPPSADSYIKLNPNENLVANVNLLEGYAISRAAKYKIVYVGQGMSGITVSDTVYFVYR